MDMTDTSICRSVHLRRGERPAFVSINANARRTSAHLRSLRRSMFDAQHTLASHGWAHQRMTELVHQTISDIPGC